MDKTLTTERLLSLAVALLYAVLSLISAGWGAAATACAVLCIPVGLIWYAGHISRYTGWGGTHRMIDGKSPAIMVRIIGWLFLLLPLAVLLVAKYHGRI